MQDAARKLDVAAGLGVEQTFQEEFAYLLRNEPQREKILNLLEVVARALRDLHARRICHGGLSNRRVFVRRRGVESWGEVRFAGEGTPLDRKLTPDEQARDIAAIRVPRSLREVFFHMYLGRIEDPSPEYAKAERKYLRRYRVERWRRDEKPRLPKSRDVWIWDNRSDQAIAVSGRWDPVVYQLRNLVTLGNNLFALPFKLIGAAFRYRKVRRRCYAEPVAMKDRVGMTIHPTPATAERELRFLHGLGPVPVLIRYYCHESEKEWDFTSRLVHRMHKAGHPVSIALVQSRRAVRYPKIWQEFLDHVLGAVLDIVDWIEIGHAINRVKWGVWSMRDYNRLVRPFRKYREMRPDLKLMGPALNDFEYHFLPLVLPWLPRRTGFDSLSLHLYVDRRGRPENTQSILKYFKFAAVDKFALARAMAEGARKCGNKVIISEVNWFLKDTDGYAHPLCPYAPAVPHANEWDVTEETYAKYMLRYYLHAICSGAVERVYWWRLASPAFGLVDDSKPEWRARPAYRVLRAFLERFSNATYLRRLPSDDDVFLLLFRQADGDQTVVAFRVGSEDRVEFPFVFDRAENAEGEPIEPPQTLNGFPVYLSGVR